MAVSDEDLARFRALRTRLRLLGESMNRFAPEGHNRAFDQHAQQIAKMTAELGKLTGADKDPEWQ